MSRIKRLVRPEVQAINWKTAVTVIGVTAAFLGVAVHAAVPMVGGMAANDDQAAGSNASSNKLKTVLTVQVPGTVIRSKKPDGLSVKKPPEVYKAARIDFEKEGCKPEYPREALRKEWQGLTALAVTTTAKGDVANVKIIKSSGYDALDNAVRGQLLSGKCTQKPGSINGVPQVTTTQVQYLWVMDVEKPKAKNVISPVSTKPELNREAQVNFEAQECRPVYPRVSLRNEETGRTELTLKVSDTGAISDVSIARSSGFRGLDEAVREQLQRGRCIAAPELQNGKPVASNISIVYVWKLD